MGSLGLQAAAGLALTAWHGINWAACHRRVRSLQRRIVQAVQAGAWRKVKRLSSLLVYSCAAGAFAVKRVTENRGKKRPGVGGKVWDTPEKKAQAIERIGRWPGYRPRPLRRLYIPKKNGQRRQLSIPAMSDRARQVVDLQALQPMAETPEDSHSDGLCPTRQCAAAIDQCSKGLRQKSSATWIVECRKAGRYRLCSATWG
jgi:RNA-directed DNA polymerase